MKEITAQYSDELKVGDKVLIEAEIVDLTYPRIPKIKLKGSNDKGEISLFSNAKIYILPKPAFEPKAGEMCQCQNGVWEKITVMPVQTEKGLVFVSIEHGFIITDAQNFAPLPTE